MDNIKSSYYKCSISNGFYQIKNHKASKNSNCTIQEFYCDKQNDCKLLVSGKCPHKK